jgi:hypothetical protein
LAFFFDAALMYSAVLAACGTIDACASEPPTCAAATVQSSDTEDVARIGLERRPLGPMIIAAHEKLGASLAVSAARSGGIVQAWGCRDGGGGCPGVARSCIARLRATELLVLSRRCADSPGRQSDPGLVFYIFSHARRSRNPIACTTPTRCTNELQASARLSDV